ncbi:MAG: phosphoethanolamine--lipid A transferase [Noviherbaspirillum sp.]
MSHIPSLVPKAVCITPARAAAGGPLWRRLQAASSEQAIVLASLFFTLFSNHGFWSAWSAAHDLSDPASWLLAAAVFALITALHCLFLGLVVTRRTARPVLAALFIVTALAAHYMARYRVFFDAGMIRSVFHTDYKEAAELATPGMLVALLTYGIAPAVLAWRLKLARRGARAALAARAVFLLAALATAGAGLAYAFQDLSALMRNHKELRYLITPANLIVSSARVMAAEGAQAKRARIPVGADATAGAAMSGAGKPRLLVVVVGETARAANWGLNGYRRNTTPELAALDVVNFTHMTSCGTNTEVSVPCMFSPFGRKAYDEPKIRRHESVLHVFEHAGIKTIWRDNQSGCKGVCEGLESQRPEDSHDPASCGGAHCFDEVLLEGFEDMLRAHPGDLVVVLHQLGNHGPAYARRHPAAYRRFTPGCDEADLGKCTQEQIVNSYDNALLYTDHFLAATIRRLQSQHSHDAAIVYVSDHGESLGEKGIYLHGMPYSIAPHEQVEVPMVMWMSDAFALGAGVDAGCLRERAARPASHDHLFHTLLGLMRVQSCVHDPAFDLLTGCRSRA